MLIAHIKMYKYIEEDATEKNNGRKKISAMCVYIKVVCKYDMFLTPSRVRLTY